MARGKSTEEAGNGVTAAKGKAAQESNESNSGSEVHRTSVPEFERFASAAPIGLAEC